MPFERFVDTLIDLPTVLPPAVAGVALLMAFGRRGLLGSTLETANIHIAFTQVAVILAQTFVAAPFYIKAAKIGFANVNVELEQSSALDGAHSGQVLRYGVLPLSRTALLGGAVMTWARALGELGATIIFAGNFPGRTQTMPLAIYLGFQFNIETALTLSVILQKADLDMATRSILFGAVGTAGQRCTSTRRIIVQKSITAELSRRLVEAYQKVRIGDPLDPDTLMGPLVVNTSVEEMMEAIKQAVADGGEILYGGRMLSELGPNFVEPAIIRMPAQTEIVKTETFAPIIYLLEYDSLEDAIRIHNDVPQGLSSAMFTDSVREAETFLSAAGSDCGIAKPSTSGHPVPKSVGETRERRRG